MMGHGGCRAGSGRKKLPESLRSVQKSVSLAGDEWNYMNGPDAKRILSYFANVFKKHGRDVLDPIFGKIGDWLGSRDVVAPVPVPVDAPAASGVKEKKKKNSVFSFSPDQAEAMNALMAGDPLFLTGGAGTGKTTLLRKFIERALKDGKIVCVAAPTGVAAHNVGGFTIHSLFRIPVKPIFTEDDLEEAFNWAKTYKGDGQNEEIINPLFEADILVIDEISMVRGDLFKMIFSILDGIKENPKFGRDKSGRERKMQLVFVGDFFQLSPIIKTKDEIPIEGKKEKTSERKLYTELYGKSLFAFSTDEWHDSKIEMSNLITVIRQKDNDFSMALNKVRIGDISGFEWIVEHSSEKENDGIWICGKRDAVEDKNNKKLAEIKATPHDFHTEYKILDHNLCKRSELQKEARDTVPEKITLKKGCKVVAIVNQYDDKHNLLFVNGQRGDVIAIDGEVVTVEFDNGKVVQVTPHVWEKKIPILGYKNGRKFLDSKVVATFSQIPLVLGYAITVHKSQGQTYKAINVDSNCNFADGQLYVALSRCESVEGVYLQKRDYKPKTSKEVQRFYGV